MILFKAFQNKHLQTKDLTFCPSNYNQQTQSFQLISEKIYIIISLYLKMI
jgi:hypothetical protein